MNSIKLKFTASFAFIVSLVLFFDLVYSINDLKTELDAMFQAQVDATTSRLYESLPVPMWHYDDKTIKRIVTSELSANGIKAIFVWSGDDPIFSEVKDNRGALIENSPPPVKFTQKIEKQVMFSENDQSFVAGRFHLYTDSSHINATLHREIIKTVVEIIVVNIVLIICCNWLLTTVVLNRIAQVTARLEEMTDGEVDVSHKINDTSNDEIGKLCRLVDLRGDKLHEVNEALIEKSDRLRSALEELKGSERELRNLVDSIEGVLWEATAESDRSLTCRYISQQSEFFFGYRPEELINTPNFLHCFVPEEELAAVDSCLAEMYKSSQSTQIPCRLIRLIDGEEETIYVRSILSPLLKNGKIVSVRGVTLDVTSHVLISQEKERLAEELQHSQKMEAVGQLASGIAHEINTPAQFVSDNLAFLRDSFNDIVTLLESYRSLREQANSQEELADICNELALEETELELEYILSDAPKAIQQSLDGTQHISHIVEAMKAFSQPGSQATEQINLNRAIENSLVIAQNEWRYVADVETNFASDLPEFDGHPDEINQSFLNLIVNAAHAIEEKFSDSETKGVIRISTRYDSPSSAILITVSDNGIGIDASVRQKIFDPFFTTKEVGKGIGHGLSLTYTIIVDKHQGQLDITSEPGVGTEFTVTLPVQAADAYKAQAATG